MTGAIWRDNIPEFVKIFAAAGDIKNSTLSTIWRSLPGMAYFGHGEYLQTCSLPLRPSSRVGERSRTVPSLPE